MTEVIIKVMKTIEPITINKNIPLQILYSN